LQIFDTGIIYVIIAIAIMAVKFLKIWLSD